MVAAKGAPLGRQLSLLGVSNVEARGDTTWGQTLSRSVVQAGVQLIPCLRYPESEELTWGAMWDMLRRMSGRLFCFVNAAFEGCWVQEVVKVTVSKMRKRTA